MEELNTGKYLEVTGQCKPKEKGVCGALLDSRKKEIINKDLGSFI